MDSGLLEIMLVTIIALVIVWLLVNFCFRILKILVTKGPGFIKYLFIIVGITSVIWIYYNPEGAKKWYGIAKMFLFGVPSVSFDMEDKFISKAFFENGCDY